jgi:hypothetical protein
MTRTALLSIAFVIVLGLPASSQAQILYAENFDVNHTANWTTNAFAPTTGSAADYFFDYSTVGIPSAPGAGGTTRGLKLEANIPGTGVFTGISVSPNGQVFLGDYRLRFQAWQNFNGPAPVGGSGSTQVTGGGIGTNGTSPQFYGGANAAANLQGVLVGVTGDGNSSADWRAYTNVGAPLAGVYGNAPTVTTNNSDPYWSTNFPGGISAPAAQLALFPQQTGNTNAGALAYAWHQWEVAKVGNTVTWTVDGILAATIDISGKTFDASNGNIFFGQWDINATSSTDPNARSLLFGLIDNVEVSAIPEPGSLLLAALASPLVLRLRRKPKT